MYNNNYQTGHMGGKSKYMTDMTGAEKEAIYTITQAIFNSLSGGERPMSQTPTSLMGNIPNTGEYNAQINPYSKYIYMRETTTRMKTIVYREMSKYPVISFAITEYVNEAINLDSDGKFMDLKIKNQALSDNDTIRKTLQAEFDHLFYGILEADDNAAKWFREWLIDGTIYFEKLIDTNQPQNGIIGLKRLSSLKTLASFDETLDNSRVDFIIYTDSAKAMAKHYKPDQVAYADSGIFEETQDGDGIEPLSFLECGKITYRKLKLLEDSMIIYRLVRAPERRIFNIDVGSLPKGKAEQYLKETIINHRQKRFFDPTTGDLTEDVDVMALTEDYYFPKFGGGRGTEVNTLEGGKGLQDMGDVDYFRETLYRGLGVPISRFGGEKKVQFGNSDDVSREEYKFTQEVARYTKRFSKLFLDIFITHLKLKGLWAEYGLTRGALNVHIFNNNLFENLLEAKNLQMKFEAFERVAPYLTKTKEFLSTEVAAKTYLRMTDEEWLLHKTKSSQEAADNVDEDEDGGGYLGGGSFGGGDLGGGDVDFGDEDMGGDDDETDAPDDSEDE